jgi:hypothetical protein
MRAYLKPIKSGAEERYADAVCFAMSAVPRIFAGWQIRWSISLISWRGRRPNRCWGMRRRRKLPFPSRVRKKAVIDDMEATGPKGNDMRRRADTGRKGRKSPNAFMQRGFVGEATLKPDRRDRWAVHSQASDGGNGHGHRCVSRQAHDKTTRAGNTGRN